MQVLGESLLRGLQRAHRRGARLREGCHEGFHRPRGASEVPRLRRPTEGDRLLRGRRGGAGALRERLGPGHRPRGTLLLREGQRGDHPLAHLRDVRAGGGGGGFGDQEAQLHEGAGLPPAAGAGDGHEADVAHRALEPEQPHGHGDPEERHHGGAARRKAVLGRQPAKSHHFCVCLGRI